MVVSISVSWEKTKFQCWLLCNKKAKEPIIKQLCINPVYIKHSGHHCVSYIPFMLWGFGNSLCSLQPTASSLSHMGSAAGLSDHLSGSSGLLQPWDTPFSFSLLLTPGILSFFSSLLLYPGDPEAPTTSSVPHRRKHELQNLLWSWVQKINDFPSHFVSQAYDKRQKTDSQKVIRGEFNKRKTL